MGLVIASFRQALKQAGIGNACEEGVKKDCYRLQRNHIVSAEDSFDKNKALVIEKL